MFLSFSRPAYTDDSYPLDTLIRDHACESVSDDCQECCMADETKFKTKNKFWQHVVGFVKKKIGSKKNPASGNCKNVVGVDTESEKVDEHQSENVLVGGGPPDNKNVVYMTQNRKFQNAEVRNILESVDINSDDFVGKISLAPPQKPKGGEVFIVFTGLGEEKNDWRCDGYRWVSSGNHKMPAGKPYVRKMYFKICSSEAGGSNEFEKFAYILLEKPEYCLIHYFGDESTYRPLPHGNSKPGTGNYVRTCPSVLKNMRKRVETESSGNVYKKMVTEIKTGVHQGVLNPRNLKQVQNVKCNVINERRYSKDDLYNLLQLAYHLPDTIWKIDLYPDMACVLGIKDVMDELNTVLETKQSTVLSYDTTFELGDFYVSPLVFRHTVFDSEPVVPVAFLIHDRKFPAVHEIFVNVLKSKVPNLCRKKFVVVMDRERALKTPFQKVFPDCQIVHCWNHIKRDVKFWLQKHGGSSDDIAVYQRDIVSIMRSGSVEEFSANIDELSVKWSQPMVEYFNKDLKSDIERHAAKFIIEPLGLYDPYSGVTNNASESMNNLIKELGRWKEAPVDVLALCFYQLQNYFISEIRRGFAGIGNYRLKSDYLAIRCDPEDICLPCDVCDPTEIVMRMKLATECAVENGAGGVNATNVEKRGLQNRQPNVTTLDDKQRNDRPPVLTNLSQKSLAEAVIREGRIVHVASMGTFMVEGSRGEKYAVSLFTRDKCQCPSTGECYHILAAKMSVGISGDTKNKVMSLTQLKRNSRKRADKKGGRKRPRINDDISVILPAPDASIFDNSIAEIPHLDTSHRSDISVLVPNHFSTPKKPGILIHQKTSDEIKMNQSPCKTPADKRQVTFKDPNHEKLDSKNSTSSSSPIKSLISDIANRPPKMLRLSRCKKQQSDSNVRDSKPNNSESKKNMPSSSSPIKSPISDIANRPPKLLRMSRGKKRKSDSNDCVSTADISESKTKTRKTDSLPPAIVDKLICNNGKDIVASKIAGACVNVKGGVNVGVKDEVQSCVKRDNISEKKRVTPVVRKLNEKGERRTAVRYWQPTLNLTFQDKFNIINGSWLSDTHMQAANDIAKSQFTKINGFQDTVRIAIRNKSGKWEIPVEHLVPVTPPSVQIHYTGHSHWVTSFQFKDDDRVFLIDTLFAGQDRLPTSLTIQLAQIYGKGQDRLEIIAPFVKSQVGGNDCGAFAIANLVEFCMGNFWRDKDSLSSRGDLCQDTLRSHLVTCFERKKFSEFMARASYGRKSCKSYFIDTSCSCGLPDEYDNMIACNGCEGWFHQVCAGVNESSLPDSWVCWECVEKGDDVIGRSPRDI